MERQRARIDGSGRLVVPAAVRRELELREGDELTFTTSDVPGEVRLTSRRSGLARAQALVARYTQAKGGVAALLEERRRDAALEQAEHEAHARRTRGHPSSRAKRTSR